MYLATGETKMVQREVKSSRGCCCYEFSSGGDKRASLDTEINRNKLQAL